MVLLGVKEAGVVRRLPHAAILGKWLSHDRELLFRAFSRAGASAHD